MNDGDVARLVTESRQGCQESFEKLLRLYEAPIFNAAYRILNNYEDARDVTQNVFLKAYENLDSFDQSYRFFSWIYRIAVNESINMRTAKRPLDNLEDVTIKEDNTPEKALSQTELDEIIQRALMSLETDYRVVIVLRHFHNCSYKDIGEILDLPEKTVKSRLFTARSLLRDSLSRKGVL
jgi:RNA polymerase sigma-70 factor, ECF subfamily